MRGATMLVQVRAPGIRGSTTLSVPFSPALAVGAVQAQVYSQTSGVTYSPLGSLAVTITDSRPVPSVSAINPSTVDLASPPASFTITGTALPNLTLGLPSHKFISYSTLLLPVRASGLTGSSALPLPLSSPPRRSSDLAQVYSQTSGVTYSPLGSLAVTITDSRPVPSVSAINPSTVDLASPPASFTITGTAHRKSVV